VTLHGLDGGPRTGVDASELLEREIGWSLPISDLRAWARGARGRDATAALEFDPQGRVEQIRQHGWTIDYRAWHEGEPRLPRKVFASNGDRRVRLIVERWDAVAPAG
jgi:outer membrane lipoprotein LolB